MKRLLRYAAGCLLLTAFPGCPAAEADSVFTIEDPPVDFEVIDADDGSGQYYFDGIGDFGPFATFNDAVLGSFGEARSMAEFDISPFTVPPDEYISVATFEVKLTDIHVFGLGVDGETPESLAADGYVGDGIEEISDFQIADGNLLDSVPTPDPYVGQVLSFDVTSFVTDLVDAQETWVGLTVRAETFGGLMMEEGDGFPRLIIETAVEDDCPADVNHDDTVDIDDVFEVLGHWGESGGPADVNNDGMVDIDDLFAVLGEWGPCP
ncbi:MAG: hypothetical protein JSV91_03700 [Phycisphaerales bacterium]|nr:MAG: hypothetical protein JSV91_03700 [Phycisphaerales bacterium]